MRDLFLTCPKCQGDMAQGFIPDHVLGETRVGKWIEGMPRKSFWQGTKGSQEESIPIGAFRCSQCGYLELYARGEFAPT
jgi:hypothetical protein